jgi:predicted RNA-binding protein YlxR (DUF448 family)
MLARVDHAESDKGPRASGCRERFCIVTRRTWPVDDLIRFVAAPDGTVVADLKRRLPGRGVWVVAERNRLVEAVKRRAFQRSLRAEVKVPGDLAESLESALERSVLDALSIARKAGQVVAGFTKVEAAVSTGMAIAVLHAADAAADGARKIAGASRRGGGPEIIRILGFTSAQLDLALGRPNVVHAALLAGRAGETFLARWRTLERYRMGDPGDRNDGAEQPTQEAPGLGSE